MNWVYKRGEGSFDRMTDLVRDEIELAKTEVTLKAKSLLRGTVAVAAGEMTPEAAAAAIQEAADQQ